MLATIDAGGRIVVPKKIRERLGLRPGTRVELVEIDGVLEIAPAVVAMRIDDSNGVLTLAAEEPMPVLTAEQVRGVLDGTRR